MLLLHPLQSLWCLDPDLVQCIDGRVQGYRDKNLCLCITCPQSPMLPDKDKHLYIQRSSGPARQQSLASGDHSHTIAPGTSTDVKRGVFWFVVAAPDQQSFPADTVQLGNPEPVRQT